jgi:hypothetical protein
LGEDEVTKKVVLISSREGGDWGIDLVWAGLVQLLGPENVVDYPARSKHRERPVLTGHHEADWGAERRSLGYTPRGHLVPIRTPSEVIEMVRRDEVGLIIVDERAESFFLWQSLQVDIWRREISVVVVAGHDSFQNTCPQDVARMYGKHFRMMFLDNWRPEYSELPWARPYAWSINFDHLWDPTKREELLGQEPLYDISFMGYNSHPDRLRFVEHIRRRWGHLRLHLVLETRPDSFGMYVPKAQYFETIARSRIALSLRGAAQNGKAMRFWEIPYVGTPMLAQRDGIVWPEPRLAPQDGHDFLAFSTEQELDETIDVLLNDCRRTMFDVLSVMGRPTFTVYHSAQHRVAWMLREVGYRG